MLLAAVGLNLEVHRGMEMTADYFVRNSPRHHVISQLVLYYPLLLADGKLGGMALTRSLLTWLTMA